MKITDLLKSDFLPVLTGLYDSPHFVTDLKGNILFSNKAAAELLLISESDTNIFDIFTDETAEYFYSVIKSCINSETPVPLQLLVKGREAGAVQVRFSFIEGAYFSCTFSREHLHISKSSGISISVEKEIADYSYILETVKQHFPFTLMGKDLIRRKTDEIKELFWIKDVNGKFILVNKAFCEYVGMPREKIEGTEEEKFIPEYLKKISASITEYIVNSGRGVKSTGILSGAIQYGRDRIELPLENGEGKVYAVLGITVSSAEKNIPDENDLFEAVPEPIAIINSSGQFVYSNDSFRNLFKVQKVITRTHYEKLFTKDICQVIQNFTRSPHKNESRVLSGKSISKDAALNKYNLVIKKVRILKEEQVFLYIRELETPSEIPDSTSKNKAYEVLIQNNPEPVFIYEKENLRFIEVNQAALNLYGFTKNEFLQMDLTDLYAPEDIQSLLSALNGTLKEGEFTGPFRQKKKDSTFLFVEISNSSLRYGDKDAHFTIIRDVTAKLETEKESRLFKAAFDNTEQLVFVTDPLGFILYSNSRVSLSLGYLEKDLEKTSFAALVKDNERANITGIFKTLKVSKKLTLELKDSKGTLIPINLLISPAFDYKNEIDAFTILGDIRKEEKIKEVTKEIIVERIMPAENNSPGGDNMMLLSGVFHEILTPINVILGFVQELTDSIDQMTPEQKEAAEIISQNRTSLLNTMNSIVEYYNIEKKTPDLNVLNISTGELMDYLQNDFSELKRSRGIEIYKGKIISSFYFETDKSKFSNLIFLLAKMIGSLTKEKRVYLSLYPVDNEKFAVTFKNSAEGITPSLLEELIRIFSNGSNTASLPKLSLKLASRLLNLFNSDLYIKEDHTEIGFIFPVKYNPVLNERKVSLSAESGHKPVEPEIKLRQAPVKKQISGKDTLLRLSQYKCLCIEDQVDSQILFKVQMKELGEIHFAASFEEALPLLDSNHFDFIVMDINLQGEYNGLDALRIIQKMPDLKNIPVIAVTAYYLPGDRENYLAAGFNEFVAKPVFRDKMVEAMEKVLKKK